MLKKTAQKGFTIVELLIVIVVIGILAALVLNTFAGVQARARDTERQTDVNALATQLEVYYNDNGAYPQFGEIDTVAEAQALLPGLDAGALDAPSNTTTPDLVNTASTGIGNYGYEAFSDTAKTDVCDLAEACVKFTLSWTKEVDDSVFTKDSLN
jgi:prepilin-type N-terminal cleavage/methylation domain-containing protein